VPRTKISGKPVPNSPPLMPPRPASSARALLFDFNGTLSDDEGLLFEVYASIFADAGRPLEQAEYLDQLVGHTDEEMFRVWLGDDADTDALTAARVARYLELAADGSTIPESVRAAVTLAAEHVAVGVVTSAFRSEVLPILQAAGLAPVIDSCVCADDVTKRKPNPEPYLLACSQLGIAPPEAIAIEDTEIGIASATAAGLRCAALTTTSTPARLVGAAVFLDAIDRESITKLLQSG
jgi:beta-phosphoglucomutase